MYPRVKTNQEIGGLLLVKVAYFSSSWHLEAVATVAHCADWNDTLQGLKRNLLNLG